MDDDDFGLSDLDARIGAQFQPLPEPKPKTNGSAQLRGVSVGKLLVLCEQDALESAPRDYYLKGILSPQEMSVWYGEPGCGKTFLALYIARAIASARSIFGLRVRQTNVLYLSLEGVSGFERRVRADVIENGEAAENFFYIAQGVNLFSDPDARACVIEALKKFNAGLLVIDTLNRALGDGSENDPSDMGEFIKAIDIIRAETQAHVMLIHHGGKDETRGMRGHSALLGAADVVVKVSKDQTSTTREAKVTKAKDDPDNAQLSFSLKVHELGTDDDGDPVTTCTVVESEPEEAPKKDSKPLSPQERDWFNVIKQQFINETGTLMTEPILGMKRNIRVATRKTVKEWCISKGLIGATENATEKIVLDGKERMAVSRILNSLREKKKIMIHNDYIWLTDE